MASRLQSVTAMHALSKALAAILTIPALAAPAAAAQPEVFFDGERISVVAFETPLRDLMGAIARETGLEVRFTSDAGDETVDVEFFEFPTADALARILAHRGHSRIGSRVWISSPVADFGGEVPVVTGGAHEGYVAELGAHAVAASSSRARMAATAELAREQSEAAVEALRNVFESEGSSQIRASALHALERSGAVSIESLADLAHDAEAGMLQRKAIGLLGRHGAGDPLAEATLVEIADTAENPMIRLSARMALRDIAAAPA